MDAIERLRKIIEQERTEPGDLSWHQSLPEVPELPDDEHATQVVVLPKRDRRTS